MNAQDTYTASAQALVDWGAVKSAPYRNRLLRESWDGVDPDFLDWSQAFLRELQARGLPFFVNDYVRDEAEQDRLFREGRSKARFGKSPHNYGFAADIIHFGRWWDLTPKQWGVVGAIGKEVSRKRSLPIVWGGDWRFYDPAHWERADWRQRVPKGKPKALLRSSFSAAFRAAYGANLETFEWRGRTYTTQKAR